MTRLDSSEPTLPVDGRGLSLAVVVARFNLEITQKLLTGCLGVLEVNGAPPPRVVWVPGAFELPVVAQRLAQTKKYDAVIVLGCVIRGETPHDRYICAETARGVGRVAGWAGHLEPERRP